VFVAAVTPLRRKTMRVKRSIVVVGVFVAGGLPASASAFPEQGSCAGEGAFVSGSAQTLGSAFGTFVAGTAQNKSLAEVIAASHAPNCEPRR
jgi:thioredoxin reductase